MLGIVVGVVSHITLHSGSSWREPSARPSVCVARRAIAALNAMTWGNWAELEQAVAAAEGSEPGSDDDKQSVLWRVKDGTAEKLVVRTGVTDGDLTEVLEGVGVGDQVIISSPAGLKPGIKVTVAATDGTAVSENK